MFETLTFEVDADMARITLSRPDHHNAYNMRMRDELFDIFTACAANAGLLAVVIAGEGRSFCSGADLSEFGTAPSPFEARRIRFQRDVWGRLASIGAITVASLHGHVIGSGMEMAMLCDLRIADPSMKITMPEAHTGLIPAATGTQTVPRAVGENWANYMFMLSERVDADRALTAGLVDHVAADRHKSINDAIRQWRELDRRTLLALKRALQRGRTGPWSLRPRSGEPGHRGRAVGAAFEVPT